MASFLLIRFGGASEVLRALAVAADIRRRFDRAEIDFATSEDNAPIASLTANIRRALALPPPPDDFSAGGALKRALDFLPGRGMLGWAAAAKEGGQAVRAAAVAGREWKEAAAKLRLREYAMAIDLQGALAGALTLRAARCGDGAGFDINSGVSKAAAMMYPRAYYVNPQKDDLARFRELASKALGDYPLGELEFNLADAPPPAIMPKRDFALLAAGGLNVAEIGEIAKAANERGLAAFVARTGYDGDAAEREKIKPVFADSPDIIAPDEVSAAEAVALARRAKVAVGAGFALQIAAAAGAPAVALARKNQPPPPALAGKLAVVANDIAALIQSLDGALRGVLAPPPPDKSPLRFSPSNGADKQ